MMGDRQAPVGRGLGTRLSKLSTKTNLERRLSTSRHPSLVQPLKIGNAFCAFGAVNKGLAWQQVAIKPGTNVACSLPCRKVCAIFSNTYNVGFRRLRTYVL